MTKFEKKVKLYCALYGNRFKPLHEDYSEQKNCKKCRLKNNGICNVRYFTHRILYEEKSGNILIAHIGSYGRGYTYDEDHRIVIIKGKRYRTNKVGMGGVCFGFLAIDEKE